MNFVDEWEPGGRKHAHDREQQFQPRVAQARENEPTRDFLPWPLAAVTPPHARMEANQPLRFELNFFWLLQTAWSMTWCSIDQHGL